MLDIWLLFGMVLPFLGFIFTIAEEFIQDIEENKVMNINKVLKIYSWMICYR